MALTPNQKPPSGGFFWKIALKYEKSSPMEPTVTMWKARLPEPDPVSGSSVVQVRGIGLEPGAQYYDPQYHKGKLCCAYCDARVHFNHGSTSVAGSFAGRDPYFATNPGQVHKDCLWDFHEPSHSRQFIDPAKGYRIHLNVQEYKDVFNERSGAYTRDSKGRLKLSDERLAGMEPLSVHSVNDLVKLLEKGRFDRINKSVVIFRNQVIEWDQFCIHHKRPERIFDLLNRASQSKDFRAPYALIEIRTDKSHAFDGFERGGLVVPSKPILMAERGARGLSQEIRLSAEINNRHNSYVMESFSYGEGSYFVLGLVRHKIYQGDMKIIHYLNVTVTDAAQVAKVDLNAIAQKGKQNALRREARKVGPHALNLGA